MSDYKHLRKWKCPRYYIGQQWNDYYVFLSQHRDSETIDRSNFIVGLEALRSLPEAFDSEDEDTIQESYENHFLVGWCSSILIHESNVAACELADEMLGKLEDYPILDEGHLQELEFNEQDHNEESEEGRK